MKKVNCIRLLFLFGTALGIGSYYLGYHKITGNYPDITLEIENKKEYENILSQDTTESVEETTETSIASSNIQKAYEYVVIEEDDYLSVYYADKKTKYMDTDIRFDELSIRLQKEIKAGKTFETSEELYDFLENYSS